MSQLSSSPSSSLLGSSLGLYSSYYLEKYYRHRREVSYVCLVSALPLMPSRYLDCIGHLMRSPCPMKSMMKTTLNLAHNSFLLIILNQNPNRLQNQLGWEMCGMREMNCSMWGVTVMMMKNRTILEGQRVYRVVSILQSGKLLQIIFVKAQSALLW